MIRKPGIQEIDLHIHSTHSDGVFTPDEIANRCAELGIGTISITDHNTIEHIRPALKAGKKYGINVIVATEITARQNGNDFHFIAYDFNPEDKALTEWSARAKKSGLLENAILHLEREGFAIDLALEKRRQPSKQDIARLVMGNEANFQKLASEGIRNTQMFIEKYLGKDNVFFEPLEKICVEEAVNMVQNSSGKIFWAHPCVTLKKDFTREFQRLLDIFYVFGLDGVEVFHPDHRLDQIGFMKNVMKHYDLLESAGSDFHGPSSDRYKLGGWNKFFYKPNLFWLN